MRPLLLAPLLVLAASVAVAAPPSVRATPARVVLGQDTEVLLEVHVPPGTGPVRAAASSGSFDAPRQEGGPVRTFRWTPPAVRHPLGAVLAFWVEDGRAPEPALVELPLLGRLTLDVSTKAGAEVVVELGDARFGPVLADGRGKARVPVEVPPGIHDARVLATRGPLRTDRRAALNVPPDRPLLAALTPESLPPDGGGWLIVAGTEGPTLPEELAVTAEGATLSVEPGGDVPRYRVKPTPGATAVAVSVHRVPAGKHTDEARARAPVLAPTAPIATPPARTDGPPAAGDTRALAFSWRPSFFALGGATLAGGANTGPLLGLGASLPMPVWNGRLAAELELGLRSVTFASMDTERGDVESRVLGLPVLTSVRVTLLQHGDLSLHGRAGVGLMPFRHRLTSNAFQSGAEESKLSVMANLSAQGAYRVFRRWSALLEVRGAWAPANTALLDAQLGGAALAVGMRYEP